MKANSPDELHDKLAELIDKLDDPNASEAVVKEAEETIAQVRKEIAAMRAHPLRT